MGIGTQGYRLRIRPNGILGRWLSFEGEIEDARPPIMYSEFLDMIGLYLVEKEEQEKSRREAGNA